ncbi:hypothetical protein OCA15_29520 [Bacillus cereus]|nr:hypothetical protein [Bacillus cereus]
MSNYKETVCNNEDEVYSIEDTLYPDNPKRKERLDTLLAQCTSYVNDIGKMKQEVEAEIKLVNKYANNAYHDFGQVPKLDKYKLTDDWYITLPAKLISSAAMYKIVSKATLGPATRYFEKMFVSNALKEGKIGIAALSKIAKFPPWFKFAGAAASDLGGILVAAGTEIIIEAIAGANTRSKLQTGIKEMYRSRLELKFAQLQAKKLSSLILHIATAIRTEAIKAKQMKYTQAEFESHIQVAIEVTTEMNNEVYKVPTIRQAYQELLDEDKRNGAYTTDDLKDQALENLIKELEEKYKNK